MTKEIWKHIPNTEDKYLVSNLGNVVSLNYAKTKKPKGLKKELTSDGHYRVTLGRFGRIKIHRAVCLAFLENPNNYPIINHKNGIKTDNMVENLEWCTQSHNALHSLNVLKNKPNNLGNSGIKSKLSKPCFQLDENRNVVGYFHGVKLASKITGINSSSIIQCCNNKRKKAGGFIWSYNN